MLPLTELNAAHDVAQVCCEARTAAKLCHPGIVAVHDVGCTEEGRYYVISEFIEGTNLAMRLLESRLSVTESISLTVTVAQALQYAHAMGIMHRNVKPSNILLDTEGRAYLADFGLALKKKNCGRAPSLESAAYMSPEQACGAWHRLDGRSDVFSLGVVFYECLTGMRPFRGETVDEVIDYILYSEPQSLREVRGVIPDELNQICLRALAKRVSDRYQSVGEMAEDLRLIAVDML